MSKDPLKVCLWHCPVFLHSLKHLIPSEPQQSFYISLVPSGEYSRMCTMMCVLFTEESATFLHHCARCSALIWDLHWCEKQSWAWMVLKKMGNPLQLRARKSEILSSFCVGGKREAKEKKEEQTPLAAKSRCTCTLREHCQKRLLQ